MNYFLTNFETFYCEICTDYFDFLKIFLHKPFLMCVPVKTQSGKRADIYEFVSFPLGFASRRQNIF